MKFERKYNFIFHNNEFAQKIESIFMDCVNSDNNYLCHFGYFKSKRNRNLYIKVDKNCDFDYEKFEKLLNFEFEFSNKFNEMTPLDCVNSEEELNLEFVQLINEIYFQNQYEIENIPYEEGDDENFISPTYQHYSFDFETKVYQFKARKNNEKP